MRNKEEGSDKKITIIKPKKKSLNTPKKTSLSPETIQKLASANPMPEGGEEKQLNMDVNFFKPKARISHKPRILTHELIPISPEILQMLDNAIPMPEGGLSPTNK